MWVDMWWYFLRNKSSTPGSTKLAFYWPYTTSADGKKILYKIGTFFQQTWSQNMVDILVDESVHSYLTLVHCFIFWCTSYLGVIIISSYRWCISFTASSPYSLPVLHWPCLTLVVTPRVKGSVCLLAGPGSRPQPLKIKRGFQTRSTYIRLIDWKNTESSQQKSSPSTWKQLGGWNKTQNIYLFLLRVLMICFWRWPSLTVYLFADKSDFLRRSISDSGKESC